MLRLILIQTISFKEKLYLINKYIIRYYVNCVLYTIEKRMYKGRVPRRIWKTCLDIRVIRPGHQTISGINYSQEFIEDLKTELALTFRIPKRYLFGESNPSQFLNCRCYQELKGLDEYKGDNNANKRTI